MRYVISSLFGAAALFCSLSSANAVTIYGTAEIGGGASTLYNIDPNTGIAAPIGTGIGFDRVSGIDFDPTTGILYGMGATDTFQLITINTTTGVGTSVGPTGLGYSFQDINFRSDGTLFGFAGSNIFTIDLMTGAATLVGFVGHAQGSGNALAFDPSDTLYNFVGADIYTINQMDGFATDTGTNVNYPVDIGTNPRTNAMDYDLPNNILYASVAHSIPGQQAATTNFIAQIDPTTGNVSNVHLTVTGLDGLAVLPEQMMTPPPNGVPEPMSTLCLVPVLIGLFAVRRFCRA